MKKTYPLPTMNAGEGMPDFVERLLLNGYTVDQVIKIATETKQRIMK